MLLMAFHRLSGFTRSSLRENRCQDGSPIAAKGTCLSVMALLRRASTREDVGHRVVRFMAGVLEHRFLTLSHGKLATPGFGECAGIVDCELIKDDVG